MATNRNDVVIPTTHPTGGLIESGLTKREYFAALAMQAILSIPGTIDLSVDMMADIAVTNADGLIDALNKPLAGEESQQEPVAEFSQEPVFDPDEEIPF